MKTELGRYDWVVAMYYVKVGVSLSKRATLALLGNELCQVVSVYEG
jgi:hypothetical protein